MNRNLLLSFLTFIAISSAVQAQEKPKSDIGKLDPEMAERKKADDGLDWYDVTKFEIEGRILPDQERLRWFDRLPASAEGTVTDAVWNLSRQSAGMMFRFKTNATAIHAHYKLLSSRLAMAHMPATGVSGIDLYARDSDGKWRWVQVTRPSTQEVKTNVVNGLAEGEREFAAYLPLYNGVDFLSIGVPPGSKFQALPPREKPIVFYGTSITHGACASRPGMVHTAILGRRFDRSVVNLGFSGNGRMHKEVGDYLTQLDASVFVIDCVPNMNAKSIAERCVPLVKQLRAAKPTTPIVLVEDRRNTNSWILPARDRYHTANHVALKEAFDALRAENVINLHYIPGDALYGTDSDGATDGSHASDLGFFRQADVFEPVLRKVLSR